VKQEDIKNKVNQSISEVMGLDYELIPGTRLKEDLGADSLDIIEIIIHMEEDFGIEIDDNIIDDLESVGDIQEYIVKLNGK